MIDFRLAEGERERAWEDFLRDLYDRGLEGESVGCFVVPSRSFTLSRSTPNCAIGRRAAIERGVGFEPPAGRVVRMNESDRVDYSL